MKEIKVTSTSLKDFSFTEGDRILGNMKYTSWFSLKAEILTADNIKYAIEPKGIFGTTIEVKKTDRPIFRLKMNWSGEIVIRKDEQSKDFFTLKSKGLFKSGYLLVDNEGRELLSLSPDFKWAKMYADYNISCPPDFGNDEETQLLIFVSVHCANYYISMEASGIM